MNKILGIIAEYNPFHNGHKYQLQKAKKETNSKYTIAIMGGNFTQRGSISLINKWDKAKLALLGGIDLVIELPLIYSISSAENFAEGAIKLLSSLKIVDYLSFGAETSDLNTLNTISDILYSEPNDFKLLINQALKKGLSFPKARENALVSYLNNPNISKMVSSPNNILGIEYLKALKKCNSSIKPHLVQRIGSDYNDKNITNTFSSSTAIREAISSKNYSSLKDVIPSECLKVLSEKIDSNEIITDLSVFEKIILYRFRMMTIEEISNLPDVSEGLEFSIKKAAFCCNNITSFINALKSKRYTLTRLQRIFLYALLNITKEDMAMSKKTEPYVRVLGFNENGKELLSKISKTSSNIKLVTSVKSFIDNCDDKDILYFINKDVFATNVYCLGYTFDIRGQLDYMNGIVSL